MSKRSLYTVVSSCTTCLDIFTSKQDRSFLFISPRGMYLTEEILHRVAIFDNYVSPYFSSNLLQSVDTIEVIIPIPIDVSDKNPI